MQLLFFFRGGASRFCSKECTHIYMYIYIYIYIYIYTHTQTHTHIYIVIMLCHQHRYPWPSLATLLYHPLLPVGLQGYTLYRHKAVVCRFYLVVLLLLIHVKKKRKKIFLFFQKPWEAAWWMLRQVDKPSDSSMQCLTRSCILLFNGQDQIVRLGTTAAHQFGWLL